MNNEQIKQKITNYIEIRKNFWTAILILTGSIAGLFLSFGSFKLNLGYTIRLIIFGLGLSVDILLLMVFKDCNDNINKLIDKLNEVS